MPKLKTAALEVPEFDTVADEPGAKVVVVPAAIVAAVPGLPVAPVAPVGPVAPTAPCGIPKFRTAADDEPELLTVAELPGAKVVVVPTATEAAVPGVPGAIQTAGEVQTKGLAAVKEETKAIDAQTSVPLVAGGVLDHPEGGVPTLVVKFHEPPVGVAGAVAEA